MYGGILNIPNPFIWHEILSEYFFLKGFQPCEIRLVVREHACHQFNVRAILICQVPVPRPSKVAAAPGPLLLTR